MFDGSNGKNTNDDFWNLDDYVKRPKNRPLSQRKGFDSNATSSVEIEIHGQKTKDSGNYSDVAFSTVSSNNGTITRFIPPHNDSVFAKKHIIYEYTPQNPLIKNVKICSDKENDSIFIQDNLFIRERRAYLNKTVGEQPYVSYYSYSPRYSNMSKAQLKWYLWWRECTRNQMFLKTDESYVVLYVYELAATEDNEDKNAALEMMCALLREYGEHDLNVVMRMMIRDVICDFCLVHQLPSPIDKLTGLDRKLLSSAPLPELFVDLSPENKANCADFICSSLSMYDYKRSKLYNEESAEIFKSAIDGALLSLINDDCAFGAITSFTDGMYGCITAERRPFARMVNIVNRNVKIEITYYQLSSLQGSITDAVRYAENKLREHFGIKSKLHILSINPHVQLAIDNYFNVYYPPMPIRDRRRRAAKVTDDSHEYDKLYDVPKSEISPDRALEIEKESWATTKILTEAFSQDRVEVDEKEPDAPIVSTLSEKDTVTEIVPEDNHQSTQESDVYASIKSAIGNMADFISLCISGTLTEQRRFSSSIGLSLDELTDRINEVAVEAFGDIILEEGDDAYRIIEDYIDLFKK